MLNTDLKGFINELNELNVQLSVVNNKLQIRAPEGVLQPHLRDKLIQYKNELYNYLEQQTAGDGNSLYPDDDDQVLDEKCLQLLRPGTAGKRFFIAHPISGGVHRLLHLAKHLPPSIAVYGIQSPDVFQQEKTLLSIDLMASYYLQQIKLIQPRGSYHIGGWCTGSLIAWQMAHKLEALGQTVSLALIDPPQAFLLSADSKSAQSVQQVELTESQRWRFFLDATLYNPQVIDLSPNSDFWQLSQRQKYEIILDFARHDENYRGTFSIDDMQCRFDYITWSLRAYAAYQPPLLKSAISCFIAEDSLPQNTLQDSLPKLPSNINLQIIPGDHFSIMLGEEVKQLAVKLAVGSDNE